MKPIRDHFGKLIQHSCLICILAKFEGQKYAFLQSLENKNMHFSKV